MSVYDRMTAIADRLRTLLGVPGALGLYEMSDYLDVAIRASDTQADLISQIKGAIGENVSKTANEVTEQATLIAEIKTALEGKAGGGTVLPALDNPATSADMAEGKQLIDGSGNVVTGSVGTVTGTYHSSTADRNELYWDDDALGAHHTFKKDMLFKKGSILATWLSGAQFGEANIEDVRAGVTFSSRSGVAMVGTAQMGGGYAIKSGTTTSGTINTGLSDVEQFFMYKESQTGTGLIHLHYTKSATSRMYASAWSTQNYGSKTITNGTGGVTVSGGTVTISATQATQGALTGNVTYKWFAIGTE